MVMLDKFEGRGTFEVPGARHGKENRGVMEAIRIEGQ